VLKAAHTYVPEAWQYYTADTYKHLSDKHRLIIHVEQKTRYEIDGRHCEHPGGSTALNKLKSS